jgi:hypothetical protein
METTGFEREVLALERYTKHVPPFALIARVESKHVTPSEH